MSILRIHLFVLLLTASPTLIAMSLKVDNFVLLDQRGHAHELFYHRDATAIVLLSHGNGCQILRNQLPDLKSIRDDYKNKNVVIMLINANQQDDRQRLASEAREWQIDFPILHDRAQTIAKSLHFKRTGEAVVIDPQSWSVVYRGPINDRVDYERQKNTVSKPYLRDVLDKLVAQEPVSYKNIGAPGCIINYDLVDGSQVSYAETIAPMLKENCVACHRPGGIAPWAMTDYAMIKGFAPMIREVLRTKRMPPWHADPDIGHWKNDVGISDSDRRTLTAWINAGAPRGKGPDPLREVTPVTNSWTLGEPDLIIEIPAFEIPATGTVEYQFPNVPNPLDRDVWVIGAAVMPGDSSAVHHILVGSSDKPNDNRDLDEIFENFILTYTPGNEASMMPEGAGVFVPKGGVYQFQMHYTPYGKKTVDQSRLGLYFSDQPPTNFYREHVIVNPAIAIPANAKAHLEKAYFTFTKDAVIHALFPHAHYRGVSSTFELEYPDGNKEVVLSVPNYDFNWQRTYQFTEPKSVPAGTRLMYRTVYDNSAKNRGNPDPDSPVYWGLQSEEEMLYGSVGFSWQHETTKQPIHDRHLAELIQLQGYLDQDLDGKIGKDELLGDFLDHLRNRFAQFDSNNDGVLDLNEFGRAFREK